MARLERESAAAPGRYRARVALLTLLGFGVLALLVAVAGFGLALLIGGVLALLLTGGTAILWLFKLGKLAILLALPLWQLVKTSIQAVLLRLPRPEGHELRRADAPALFAQLDELRSRLRGPRFHHVLLCDDVNAAMVQRPALGLLGFPRNHLVLGLPLLEAMTPPEALAVVAHEYGHLAGSHGRFSAFVYRLRHSWGAVQTLTDQIQGWLGRLVAPVVRWYAPTFNAYTFVLARADEYQADAAAAELVGAAHAAAALKRVNVVAPRHERFLAGTFERMVHDEVPPADLALRWAGMAASLPEAADAERWLADALDREPDVADTHPTLRARLAALGIRDAAARTPPPPIAGASAAQAWLGDALPGLRARLQAEWARQVAGPWAERHARARQDRERLQALRAMPARAAGEQLEMLHLQYKLEPEADLREPLAAFNAEHADHATALFLEGLVRARHGEREALRCFERAMALDAEAICAACEHAHALSTKLGDAPAAEAYAERWRHRHALEAAREQQLHRLDAAHALVPHGLDESTLAAMRARFAGQVGEKSGEVTGERAGTGGRGKPIEHVSEAWLARRVLPADPEARTYVLGVRLSWWGRRLGRQAAVIKRLAALEWPVHLMLCSLDGGNKAIGKKLVRVVGARLH